MNAIQLLATHGWVERLGMTLLHFLWQGAIIAGLYAAARSWGAKTWNPNGRYFLACVALIAMALAPVVTCVLLRGPSPESAAASFMTPLSSARTGPAQIWLAGSTSLGLPGDANSPVPFLNRPEPFLCWVVAIWIVGATIVSLRLLGGWIFAERLRSRMVRPAPAEWQQTLDRLKARLSISRPVRLLVSGLLRAPAAVGWLRPVVLTPAGALAGLPPAQIEALLLHELAHIRRHDYLVNLLQSAVEAIFFYHPAVWWISGHLRVERELCCDDIAVSVTGDAIGYARALAEFDATGWIQPTVMAANGGSLADRIGRLLGRPPVSRRASYGPGTAAAPLLLAMGAWAVFAESTGRPQFEVASIKPSISTTVMNVRPLPGRLTADASLPILMQYAYGVQSFQIVGARGWMQSDRYQIDAKAEGNANRDRMFLMLQSLLENRFQLQIHREMHDLPVYTLIPAKSGLKLPRPRDGSCVDSAVDAPAEWAGGRMAAPGEVPAAQARCGSTALNLGPGGARMQGGKIAMPELVRRLSLLLGRSVVDKTGFTDAFDLQLDFVPDDTTPAMPPPPPDSGISGLSIAEALRTQFGLQLESTKGPVEVIVIDRAEKPSEN